MASSIVDKYEQILAADPRSRIFVELAKALVDRGDHARAIEICRRGLEHHPTSILGRVTWGRALLGEGDTKGAVDQFEIAIALDPAAPYAYNHVGEALVSKGLFKEALPVLARAAELQPGDARIRSWLQDAKHRARAGDTPAVNGAPQDVAADDGGEATEPYRPLSPAARAAAGEDLAPPKNGSEAHAAPLGAAASASTSAPTPPSEPTSASTPTASPAAPPPLPRASRSVLYMIPGGSTRDVIGAPSLASRLDIPAGGPPAPAPPRDADPAEAERAAAEYERTLREKLLAAPEPPPPFVHRHRRTIAAAIAAVAVVAAAVVYLVVSSRNAASRAAGAATLARAGLARDTLGSLREAHRLLAEARKRSRDPETVSLAAQVAAVLAAEHGDERARESARALAAEVPGSDGDIAARYLLADGPGDQRAEAEAAVLAARPSSGPLVQALAGRILVGRGEVEGGRGRLELAARANPPLLRALSDLGDLALARGDADGALALYGAALAAHPTHPRSAIGAAEARLALDRDLEVSRKELARIEADEASRPPRDVKLRFEIASARVQAALGDPGGGAARLARFAETAGESPPISTALAGLYLQARAWEKAETAARRALSAEPERSEPRVLLARALVGRGRFAAALAATADSDGRAIRLQRVIARYRLGQLGEARAELERLAHDGKLAADAAVWFVLVDVASGRAGRALPLVQKLAGAKAPPPLAHLALGRTLEALGRRSDALAAYRTAAEREPDAPEALVALGRLLLSEGKAHEALAPLQRAVKIDPTDLAARRLLGEARLAAGQPSAARADLDFVLLAAPRDASALRLLSSAWLAEGQPQEARRAADRAVSLAPKDPAVLVAGAKASLAAGDAAAARKLAARALKARPIGSEREEAKRIASGQLPRRR